MLQLKELENSRYLIQDEYKKYYSELTDIVRSYLDEDVNISALESTTDQLIERLELLKDAGELKIDEDTINQFQRVLKTADLVKFAKSKPPTSVAEQDRTVIQNIVVKTKEALPEPDLEDLLKNEAYLEELAKKKQRNRIYIAAAALASLLILAGATATTYYGFTTVKDTVLGHPTKKLLEQEWVTSTYGFPPIQITTPEVLLRQEVELPPEAKKEVKAIHVFGYQSDVSLFTVLASATTFAEANEPDFDKPIEQLLSSFEQQGAKNIITKQEEFTTVAGVKGLKTFGSGKFKIPDSEELIQGKYTILSFGGNGFMQQIVLTWLDEDIYAEQIVERVLASVDVKTQA